ncbi:MAG: TetR/AcrR family transcriptional regulator [Actinobacteria bacterium]|nr:TetR/AcrR family transcriptional regulator [Actinomycetota bacterium]
MPVHHPYHSPKRRSGEPALSRRERRRIETEDEILQTAREILAERGLGNLSLREVARRTGFCPTAIYRYFDHRDDLIHALAERAVSSLAERLKAVPRGLPPDERAVELGMAYLDFARNKPHDTTLFLLHDSIETVKSSPGHQQLLEIVFGIFKDGADSGMFELASEEDIRFAAFGAWALVEGLAGFEQRQPPELGEKLRAYHQAVLQTYIEGLKSAKFGV